MDKRKFLQLMGKGALTVAAGPAFLQSCTSVVTEKPAGSAGPKLWAWARPGLAKSADEWKAKLGLARENGITGLLLEVYNSSNAFFDTNRLPVRENLVELVLPICKDLGIEFHTWMWTMPCNIPEIAEQNPDWFAVNGNGEPSHTHPAYVGYYKFMCPNHPEVREFVAGNVRDLASISEIDGVHLDYVRLPDVILAEALQPKYDIIQDREYPEYDYCYNEICRNQFKEETGIDPLEDLEDPSANEQWRQFRYNSVSTMVNDHLVPEARNKGKMISAAVFPNWESVRQQWSHWNLDAFFPMLYNNFYNEGVDWIGEQVKEKKSLLQNDASIYSGLYLPELSTEELQQAMEISVNSGAEGISFFNLGALTEEDFAAVRSFSERI